MEGNGTLQSPPGVVVACVWTIIYKTTNEGKNRSNDLGKKWSEKVDAFQIKP